MTKIVVTGGSGFIGTNLIDYLKNDYDLINIDKKPPIKSSHKDFWVSCNLLDKRKLEQLFRKERPQAIVHLAARADVDGISLDDYKDNTEGTRNVIYAANTIKNDLSKLIITSTQFVYQADGYPSSDWDYEPYTIYGESKVVNENDTRELVDKRINWTIIRPTNIWGPWHWRYPDEFWKVLSKGLYFHPRTEKPIYRSYGFVLNVCHQIRKILELPNDKVHKEVFYVGDEPIELEKWVNAFSLAQTGRKVKVVPGNFIKFLAIFGDVTTAFGLGFPITSSRFKSMTTSNSAPMKKTIEVLGYPPYSLQDGVNITTKWLKNYHPKLVKI